VDDAGLEPLDGPWIDDASILDASPGAEGAPGF
jgi:hypothetical protein